MSMQEVAGGRLQRIMSNLISNALKYSAPETPVTVRVHARNGWVELAVSDEGQGIDPADLPHIFERFSPPKGGRKDECPPYMMMPFRAGSWGDIPAGLGSAGQKPGPTPPRPA